MASVYPFGHTEDQRCEEIVAMHRIIGCETFETLRMLNGLYGRGELKSVTFDRTTGRGVATRYILNGEDTSRFRIIDGVVHFRGHHRKIRA